MTDRTSIYETVATQIEPFNKKGVTLSDAKINAKVDDHAMWSADARHATDTIGIVALSAVFLLGATGIAVIAFATHATLLARRDIVELLHLTGTLVVRSSEAALRAIGAMR